MQLKVHFILLRFEVTNHVTPFYFTCKIGYISICIMTFVQTNFHLSVKKTYACEKYTFPRTFFRSSCCIIIHTPGAALPIQLQPVSMRSGERLKIARTALATYRLQMIHIWHVTFMTSFLPSARETQSWKLHADHHVTYVYRTMPGTSQNRNKSLNGIVHI